jgi:hypothetical protein
VAETYEGKMTLGNQELRAKIDNLRLSIDQYDAGLKREMIPRARDSLRKRRLAAGEELTRLWAQLEGSVDRFKRDRPSS